MLVNMEKSGRAGAGRTEPRGPILVALLCLGLLGLAATPLAADQPKPRLDPMTLGLLGFRLATGGSLATVSGYERSGGPLSLAVAPARPAIVFFFSARLASARAVLAGLEELRSAYAGRAGFVAVSADPPDLVEACVKGLALSLPVLADCDITASDGLGPAPGFLVLAPGGRILALRKGSFDWKTEGGRALLDEIVGLYPDTRPELFAMPGTSPVSAGRTARVEGAGAARTAPQSRGADAAGDYRQPSWFSPLEAAVLEELNYARTRPAEYADILREFRLHVSGGLLSYPGRVPVRFTEDKKAVDEAIAFLERQKPLVALLASQGLSRAARDLAADQGRTGKTGHEGSDLSTPFSRMERYGSWVGTAGENCSYGPDTAREIVIELIVDDDVPGRGHRANIFNKDFVFVGLAVGPHPGYGAVCVQDFAWSFKDR
jgi:hypothetical protein